jgi:hypothetical protein
VSLSYILVQCSNAEHALKDALDPTKLSSSNRGQKAIRLFI